MKCREVFIGAVLLLASCLGAQGSRPAVARAKHALLVVENRLEDGVLVGKQLVRLVCKEGHLWLREVLFRGASRAFGWGPPRLIGDRFVVFAGGTVFDLSRGLVAADFMGRVVHADAERLVLRGKARNEHGLFTVNLETGRRMRTTVLPGVYSPDGRRSVTTNYRGELQLHDATGPPTLLAAGLRARLSGRSSSAELVSAAWIDNKTILTQTGNGVLVTVDLLGKMRPLVRIDVVDELGSPPRFERDVAGRWIYRCRHAYVVDPATGSAKRMRWRTFGHGFEVEVVQGDAAPTLRHDGRQIGRFLCAGHSGCATAHYLAIPYAKNVKSFLGQVEQQVQGVMIWDRARRQWIRRQMAVAVLVGWVSVR